jgi:hypothetical protein
MFSHFDLLLVFAISYAGGATVGPPQTIERNQINRADNGAGFGYFLNVVKSGWEPTKKEPARELPDPPVFHVLGNSRILKRDTRRGKDIAMVKRMLRTQASALLAAPYSRPEILAEMKDALVTEMLIHARIEAVADAFAAGR